MFLKVCINGARKPNEHAALPLTPEAMAIATADSVAAGADAVHLHVRARDLGESMRSDDVARTVDAVRARCGDLPVGVSTGEWIEPDLDRRLALIRGWTTPPDFASVNMEEAGALAVCRALLDKGVGIEAGFRTVEHARRLAEARLADKCLRVLIEPIEPDAALALATARAIDAALDASGIDLPRLTHGFNAAVWPLFDLALELGHAARVGLEDTLRLPNRQLARDNAALVRAARERAAGRSG
jgi:uncharacterized protein (DUF849 family)